jgi:hypothetical protein
MTDETTQDQGVAAWLRDSALSVVAILLVLAVAGSGWSASFIALHSFAMAHMGFAATAAWLVPGTFDGAAFGLSLLAFRAATYGRASLGARLYVYGFTALSSWINFVHITDRQGRLVACLLPISAVVVFDKVLREAREAYERRHKKVIFKVRPGLLLLRLAVDRKATATAIRSQIAAIPVEALIGMGAGTLAKDAREAAARPEPAPVNTPAAVPAVAPVQASPALPAAPVNGYATAPAPAAVAPVAVQTTDGVDQSVDEDPYAPVMLAPVVVDSAPAALVDSAPIVVPEQRLGPADAAEVIRNGWANGWGVNATAEAATRDKSYVSRRFAKFDTEAGRTVHAVNGSAH